MKTYTVDYQDSSGFILGPGGGLGIESYTGQADDMTHFIFHVMPPVPENAAIVWVRETMKEDGSPLLRRTDRGSAGS